MKKESNLVTRASEPEKVDAFLARKLKYPLSNLVQYLREFILSIDKELGEEIFYNAPAFFYTGKMKPFKPKEYKRYIRWIQPIQTGLFKVNLPKRGKRK